MKKKNCVKEAGQPVLYIVQIWLLCCKIYFSKSPPAVIQGWASFFPQNTQNKYPAICWMWETDCYRLKRTNVTSVKSKLCQLIFELLYVLSLWIHNNQRCKKSSSLPFKPLHWKYHKCLHVSWKFDWSKWCENHSFLSGGFICIGVGHLWLSAIGITCQFAPQGCWWW